MSESKNRRPPLFSLEFNRSVKVRSESPDITSNAGVLLLREVDHILDITASIAKDISDPRNQDYIRYGIAELLRERIYAIAAGYSRQDDADIIAHDPAFKIAVWEKPGTKVADERLASQPTSSRLAALLSQWHNREALRHHLLTPILRHQRQGGGDRKVSLGVVDVDGFPVETHGAQPGAEYNGYYGKTVYSPLAAFFSPNGTFDARRLGGGFLHAALRNGAAAPAEGAGLFLDEAIDKARLLAKIVAIRADAAFAGADILNQLDGMDTRFTIRLPENAVLERLAAPYLTRPPGRPPKEGYEFAVELAGYKNPRWNKEYRVVLVVVDKPGKDGSLALFPHHFFIVTNWTKERFAAWELVTHYRQRGTFEDRLGEWNALGLNLSQDSFAKNEVTLLLSMLAFNLLEILRTEMERAKDPRENPPHTQGESGWDMARFQNIMLKVGGKLSRGGRRLWMDIADGIAPLWQALLTRVGKLRRIRATSPSVTAAFTPLPSHAHTRFTPRM